MCWIVNRHELELIRSETTPAAAAAEAGPAAEPEATPAATETKVGATAEKKEESVGAHCWCFRVIVDTQPKALKAGRRLSTRFISGIKNFGKKDHPAAKEEKKEATETPATEETPAAVADEAPKLEKPIPAEPLKIEEVSRAANLTDCC